jgi:HEAT repeat protein
VKRKRISLPVYTFFLEYFLFNSSIYTMDVNESDNQIHISHYYHQKLKFRVDGLESFRKILLNDSTKAGLVKKLLRIIVYSLLFRKYNESNWISAQYNVLMDYIAINPEAFSVIEEIIEEYLSKLDDDSHRINLVSLIIELISQSYYQKLISQTGTVVEHSAIKNILSHLVFMLDQIGDQKYIEKIHKLLNQLFSSCPKLRQEILHFICNHESKPIFAWIMIFPHLAQNMDVSERLIALILDSFTIKVVQIKSIAGKYVLERYLSFLPRLHQQHWQMKISASASASDCLESMLLKLLKKSPEGSSALVSSILSHIHVQQVDLSQFIVDGGHTCCLRLLKSAEASVRNSGENIVMNLFQKCASVDAVGILYDTLIEAVSGKGGALVLEHRTSIWTAIRFFYTTSYASESILSYRCIKAGALLSMLIPIIEKEVDESQAHLLSIHLLGAICQHLSALSYLPKVYLDQLSLLGNNNPKHRLVALEIIMTMIDTNQEFVHSISGISANLVSLIKDASKKPLALQPDAILAVSVLLVMSKHSLLILSSEVQKIFSTLLSSTASASFLTAPALKSFISSLEVSSGSLGMKIYGNLLRRSLLTTAALLTTSTSETFTTTVNLEGAVELFIIYGLLSADRELRKFAVERSATLIVEHPSTRPIFLSYMINLCNEQAVKLAQHETNRSMNYKALRSLSDESDQLAATTTTSVSTGALRFYPASRILNTMIELVKQVSAKDSSAFHSWEEMILIIEMLAHPLISASEAKALQVWKSLSNHCNLLSTTASSTSDSKASFIEKNLTYLFNATKMLREGGQIMMRILSFTQDSNLFQEIFQAVIECLKQRVTAFEARSLTLSAFDMLLLTNFDIACEQYLSSTSSDSNPAAAASSSQQQKKSGKVASEEEQWLERIKKDKEKASQASKDQSSYAISANNALTEKKRVEVTAMKSSLESIYLPAKYSIEVINHLIISANKDVLTSLIAKHQVHESLMSMLTNDLLAGFAYQALLVLVSRAVSPSLHQSLMEDLPLCLSVIARVLNRSLNESIGETMLQRRKELIANYLSPLQSLLRILVSLIHRSSTSREELSFTLVLMIYPILESLLLHSAVPLPGCDQVVFILDACFHPAIIQLLDDKLVTRLIHVCLISLSNTASYKYEPSAETLLCRLSEVRHTLNEQQYSLIVGDQGQLSEVSIVRLACLHMLSSSSSEANETVNHRIYLLQFDESELVASCARSLCQERGLTHQPADEYLPLLSHPHRNVRDTIARAIADSFAHLSDNLVMIETTLQTILQVYHQKLPAVKQARNPQENNLRVDAHGKIIDLDNLLGSSRATNSNNEEQDAMTRTAIITVFTELGKQKSLSVDYPDIKAVVIQIYDFLLAYGVIDASASVRKTSLEAGRSLSDSYGFIYANDLFLSLQAILSRKLTKEENPELFDQRHEAAVVLLGYVGRHLPKDDLSSIISITETLIESLKTPSESVQLAVADSLTSLIPSLKGQEAAGSLIEKLISQVLHGESYGERRGAAYGIAAMIKGLGVTTLKQHDIINRLRDACASATSPNTREGSLFAMECLSDRLGLLFEPYITTIIPVLLKSFSHGSEFVRDAARTTAKVIMERLSAHGIKQVLAPILASLPSEPQYKSRQEAIRLLGTIAFCNPKQLSLSLPQVIPKLVEATSDPHPKVKESAKAALADISSVIKNPEIGKLAPHLLSALSDPANKTKDALEALLTCEFLHAIDPPSLAMLIPILIRGLKDRSGDVKRKSSAIVGNIIAMISEGHKVLAPYLPQLFPGLQDCLMDPIPDVRTTASKALGKIIRGLGSDNPETNELILSWCLSTLRSENSSVERSGAAQGLAEVCNALDRIRIEAILQRVLEYKNSTSAAREGLLWFFSFLPSSLQENFTPYISTCLPIILSGLSDDDDGVREVALRAGQVIVTTLGKYHAIEILPSLTQGMFDDDERIRHASISLLGELIQLISDSASNMDDADEDEDDMYASSAMNVNSKTIINLRQKLGLDITDNLLASLYIIRSDTSSSVRQISLSVWKSMVSNTGKTLVEIMAKLVSQMMNHMSSASVELRYVASRSLGEVVRKHGDRILPLILPYIQQGYQNPDSNYRQGISFALIEIIAAANKKQLDEYATILIPALIQCLCDPMLENRQLGGKAFQSLLKAVGSSSCLDHIIPILLSQLEPSHPEQESAILGLKELVITRPRDLLDYLVPRVLVSPMTAVQAVALTSIASVGSAGLHYHYSELIPNLIRELINAESSDDGYRHESIKAAATAVMAATTTSGINYLTTELGKLIEHESNLKRRQYGCFMLELFFSHSKAEYLDYLPVFLKFLLARVADHEVHVLTAVHQALSAMVSGVSLDSLMQHIDFINNCIASTASDARHRTSALIAQPQQQQSSELLPLLSINKALEPFLTIYLHGLTNGSVTIREQAAEAFVSIIQMCDVSMLKPFLIKSTGPLIRILGERYPSSLKATVVQALILLLQKGGSNLKAFAPQLQTTFIKTLSDPSKNTRSSAVLGLRHLMPLVTRIDPILLELSSQVGSCESLAIKASLVEAIGTVLIYGGEKATVNAYDKVVSISMEVMLHEDEAIRHAASLIGLGLGAYLDNSGLDNLLTELIEAPVSGEAWTSSAGRILSLPSLMIAAGNTKIQPDKKESILSMIASAMNDERGNGSMKASACKSLSILFTIPKHSAAETLKAEYRGIVSSAIHRFVQALCNASQDIHSSEIRKAAFHAIKQVFKALQS